MSQSNENDIELENEYSKSIQYAVSHYENFPVISFFVPKRLRKHTAIVYQFARQADDIADEGQLDDLTRMTKLDGYQKEFEDTLSGNYSNGFWKALHNTILQKKINSQYFINLLLAFKQDLVKKTYSNYKDVNNYCEKSANPVGRIVLEIYGIIDNDAKKYSDDICTALQLTNFYQDISVDILKDRIYIPQEDIIKFNVNKSDIVNKKYSENFKNLMKFEIERTKLLFEEGRKLLPLLPLRLKYQILITIKGGEAILRKIEESNYDVLSKRPTLTKFNFIKLFASAILLRK